MATWVNLLDIVYPVGSIYQSTSSTSPASRVGGTWSAIGGRFLLGANSTYPVNKQDGAATVTLSVGQMPRHSHDTTIYNLQYSASAAENHTTYWSGQHSSSTKITSTTGGGGHTTTCLLITQFISGEEQLSSYLLDGGER